MIDDRIHKVDEFPSLPWDKLDPDKCTTHWSFGWGGYGFRDHTMTITVPDPQTGLADIWEVPEPLAAIVAVTEKIAADKARSRMREALGVQ